MASFAYTSSVIIVISIAWTSAKRIGSKTTGRAGSAVGGGSNYALSAFIVAGLTFDWGRIVETDGSAGT